jgi:hypothetical protein
MPPWFADPKVGHFVNDRSIAQNDIDKLVRWADAGAPAGDAKDAPPPIAWPDGWQIKPDLIVKGPTYDVPANPKNNVVEWILEWVPTGFTEDTWITSVEIKTEHPEVTHHVCIGFNPHKPDVKYYVPEWDEKARDEDGSALPDKGPTFGRPPGNRRQIRSSEDCYVPGNLGGLSPSTRCEVDSSGQ